MTENAAPALVGSIRRLAQRLRHHGELLEQRNVEVADSEPPIDPAPARHAADQVDAAAEAVRGDRGLADDIVREALDAADVSVTAGAAGEHKVTEQ